MKNFITEKLLLNSIKQDLTAIFNVFAPRINNLIECKLDIITNKKERICIDKQDNLVFYIMNNHIKMNLYVLFNEYKKTSTKEYYDNIGGRLIHEYLIFLFYSLFSTVENLNHDAKMIDNIVRDKAMDYIVKNIEEISDVIKVDLNKEFFILAENEVEPTNHIFLYSKSIDELIKNYFKRFMFDFPKYDLDKIDSIVIIKNGKICTLKENYKWADDKETLEWFNEFAYQATFEFSKVKSCTIHNFIIKDNKVKIINENNNNIAILLEFK